MRNHDHWDLPKESPFLKDSEIGLFPINAPGMTIWGLPALAHLNNSRLETDGAGSMTKMKDIGSENDKMIAYMFS